MTDRELMQQALDAQEKILRAVSIMNDGPDASDVDHAENLMADGVMSMRELRNALRERLAQPDPEPCQHEWVRTGGMREAEARCLKCGAWKSEEKPDPEPVLIVTRYPNNETGIAFLDAFHKLTFTQHALYTHPPRRGWQGLTDNELANFMRATWGRVSIAPQSAAEFARAIEAALRSKND